MKKELVDLQPKLEQAKIENNSIMKVKVVANILLFAILSMLIFTW